MNPHAPETAPHEGGRSRLGGLGLLLRHRRPVRGPSLLVALMVLAVAALVAATPAVFTTMTARELAQTVAKAPPESRFLISRPSGRILARPSLDPAHSGLEGRLDDVYGTWQDQLAALRTDLPQPLRSLVGPPGWSMTTEPVAIGPTPAADPPAAFTMVVPRVDVHADRVARLVAGRWPVGADPSGPPGIVLSEQAAKTMGVTVGSLLGPFPVAGIFRPLDDQADYWALNPGMVRAGVVDDGNAPVTITVTAFIDPVKWNATSFRDPSILVWYPLDLSDLSGGEASEVVGQLRGVVAAPRPLPLGAGNVALQAAQTIRSLTVGAGMIGELDAAASRVRAAGSVLTVASSGPLAAAIAVLLLATRALTRRRRPLIALLAARGASPVRLRLLLALEGLAIGFPPAAVAALVMWWLFGVNASLPGLVFAVLVGLLPAALQGAVRTEGAGVQRSRALARGDGRAPSGRGDGRGRSARGDSRAGSALGRGGAPRRMTQSGLRTGNGARWVAEVTVLALAAISLYLLLGAGLGGGAGTDLLVAAAPLLLAGAACVVVLRLYPVPLRMLSASFRRRRGAVGFLGSVRALRDPAVGVVPVLAVLAGVSVAVFSAVTLSTVTHGADQAALTDLGAPMRVTGGPVGDLTEAQYARLQKVPGVAAAARVAVAGSTPMQVPGRATKPTVEIYLADTAALAAVQRAVPGAVPIPVGLESKPVAGVVLSANLGRPGMSVTVGSVPARVMGSAEHLTGLGRSTDFALFDSAVTGFGTFRPDAVLIAPAPGADTATVAAAVTSLLGPDATVRLASADATALRSGAMASGIRLSLIAALVTCAVAAVASLLLTMVSASATRTRLLAIVRILGYSLRQRRALVLWEQTPAAAVALLVGSALGFGLAALVRQSVDLTPFTGGAGRPALYVQGTLLAALLGGFVALVAVATWVGLLLTRQVTAAAAVKVDEE